MKNRPSTKYEIIKEKQSERDKWLALVCQFFNELHGVLEEWYIPQKRSSHIRSCVSGLCTVNEIKQQLAVRELLFYLRLALLLRAPRMLLAMVPSNTWIGHLARESAGWVVERLSSVLHFCKVQNITDGVGRA